MPVNAAVTPTSHHCLRDDPTTLHRCHINDIETLTQWYAISAVSINKNPIASIHLDSVFLKEQTHWNLGSVVGGHEHLLAIEFISDDLGSM
jgi:hypothetical protein